MPPQPDLFDPPPGVPPAPPAPPPAAGDAVTLAHYAERAYLEYALSVVKGRALPDVCDGQKPVQRRIVFSMQRMGLAPTTASGARPVKSARVVGDVLGRFHPHGDQAAYDALVRMAQGFSQRYPLVDGQGNFGSRDGDSAAAMRYTEARLTPIARLLLDEIDEGTVDFVPNYDGSTEEPRRMPARLPFVLLNGASGIAVGLATEIPSHNLGEIAAAAVALLKDGALDDDALAAFVPGPDWPGGGQLISSADEIRAAYASGRGSLKVRARWHREDLARGQWQIVVDELPPGTSTQSVLQDIEALVNPQPKAGRKAPTPEQLQLKTSVLAVLETVRDESDKSAPVRLVLEPRSSRIDADAFMRTLLAHTSLESSAPVNLTMIGADGRPAQKSLRQVLLEWTAFRRDTVRLRSEHRLGRLRDRIHVLEGRQTVLLNIDEVIAIIRTADEPKAALIKRFALSERQADDILDIRLRQLARLEAIKIEQELAAARRDADKLAEIVAHPGTLQRTVIREIEADARLHGDARRTFIQPDRRASVEVVAVDEPVTVVVSDKGWVRTVKGHEVDPAALPFKPGDALHAGFACRSVDPLLVFGSPAGGSVRVYTVPVAALPGGRGDGQPVTSMIDLERGTQPAQYWAGAASQVLLLAGSGSHGLLARVGDMASRQRGGKAFFTLDDGEALLPLVRAGLGNEDAGTGTAATRGTPRGAPQVACLTRGGRLLVFALHELKLQGNGGRGLTLVDLADGDVLISAIVFTDALRVHGTNRSGKPKDELLRGAALATHVGRRARKGKLLELGMKTVLRLSGDTP